METFIYKTFGSNDVHPVELAEAGKEGWELVTVIITDTKALKYYFYFKKRN